MVAIAAPVDAGAKFTAPDLPFRASFFEGASTKDWEAV